MNSDDLTLADIADAASSELFTKAWRAHAFREDSIEKGYYTYERVMLSASGNRVLVRQGSQVRQMVMMASNNFLGLNNHPRLIRAGQRALETYGVGSAGAPATGGMTSLHRALEERCADFLGYPSAMVFSAGYAANQGTLAALMRKGETAFLDELVHASIIDGAVRSEGKVRLFAHNDVKNLEEVMRSASGRKRGRLVVVDGAYSMLGDLCPLPELLSLARAHGARLMVDEAHCLGVLGKTGRGVSEHFGIPAAPDITVGTFSKALGVMGGFVASSEEVISYLRMFARTWLLSSAPPPFLVATALEAFDVIEEEPELRERLWENVVTMQRGLRELGFDYGNPHCGIVSIIVGDDMRLRRFSKDLHEAGVYASAVPYPAVPQGQCRIRLGLMATHTKEDIELTLDALARIGRRHGVIQG